MAKKQTEQPPINNEDGVEIDLLHRTLLEEEGLKQEELPEDIQELISRFDGLENAYNDNPSEKNFYQLQELDATIADEIQTYIEDKNVKDDSDEEEDYDPNEDETNQNQTNNQNQEKMKKEAEEKEAQAIAAAQAQEAANAAAIAAQQAADAEARRIAEEEAKKPSQEEVLTEKVKSKLRNGRISNADLSAILGIDEATAKSYKVGNVTLSKVFLGDGEYELS